MTTEDATYAVLKNELARFFPIRVLIKEIDGKITGITEESFSMGESDSVVRIWWSGKAYSILGEHIINGIEDAEHNARDGYVVVDPLAEDCPIEVDWTAWRSATSKYSKRNAPFKKKQNEDIHL